MSGWVMVSREVPMVGGRAQRRDEKFRARWRDSSVLTFKKSRTFFLEGSNQDRKFKFNHYCAYHSTSGREQVKIIITSNKIWQVLQNDIVQNVLNLDSSTCASLQASGTADKSTSPSISVAQTMSMISIQIQILISHCFSVILCLVFALC